jgi:hypothetical protein
MAPISGGGAIPGPWTGAVVAMAGCPSGTGYTSSAATCAGYGIGVAGAYCDTGFVPASSPTPPHMICTVAPSPGVTLSSVAAGWDIGGPAFPGAPAPPPGSLGGPASPPDGNLDNWDLVGAGTGVAVSTAIGPGGTITVHVYPAPFPSGTTTYQIIVYVGASSVLPAGLAAPLTAACQ